jgi:hypothetical protein
VRILIIAPTRAELPNVAAEAGAVASAHSVKLLQGIVGDQAVLEAVSAGGYDVIWFATHSGEKGLMLSTELIDPDTIASYVASSGACLAIFNSCSSVFLGMAVLEASNAHVICTISSVPDLTAMRTGVMFASQLALLGNFREAYERSKPGGNKQYLYLTNCRQPRIVSTPPRTGNTPTSDKRQIDRLGDMIEAIKDDLHEVRTDIAVMKGDITGIKEEQTRLRDRIEIAPLRDAATSPANWQTWLLLIMVIIAAVAGTGVLIIVSRGLR